MHALKAFLDAIDDPEGILNTSLLRRGVVIAERYRLRDKIARGGMATVWEADDIEEGRVVAIKFLAEDRCKNALDRKRFEIEAKTAARLRSRYVAEIYGHGVLQDVPFIVMERLHGEDLQQRLDDAGRLTLPAVAKIVEEAGRALHEAHALGIVHRDIKPRNLFLAKQDDAVTLKLVDFGVAKNTAAGEIVTRTGALLGSPAYMSPEQVVGDRSIDHRTDLWSLGIIVYRALTGELPFRGEMVHVMEKITQSRPAPPSTIDPSLPSVVDGFIAKSLAKRREDRFQDAKEFMTAFEEVVRKASEQCPVLLESDPPPSARTSGTRGKLRSHVATMMGPGPLVAVQAAASITSRPRASRGACADATMIDENPWWGRATVPSARALQPRPSVAIARYDEDLGSIHLPRQRPWANAVLLLGLTVVVALAAYLLALALNYG